MIQKDKIIKDKRVDGDEDFLRLGRRQQNGNDRRGEERSGMKRKEKKREEMRGSNIK